MKKNNITKNSKQVNSEFLNEFEKKIGYEYKDKRNLLLALTHSSYANENKDSGLTSNERLEFLGDAVLNIIISDYLYNLYPDLSEGELTKTRASIVCEASLAKYAERIDLGKFLLLGRGEELTGGRQRISVLSDAFEAVLGSLYLDGGMETARKFISDLMMDQIKGREAEIFVDYKTQLQELIQKTNDKKITYEIISEEGPDHDKTFLARVKVGDEVLGSGEGKSKKEAEQMSAQSGLRTLELRALKNKQKHFTGDY